MRWSQYYLFTTREVPADAEVVSHRLMARAGLIKKVSAGIYSYLPLGWRSLRKLMEIVRRELEVAGSVELSMPTIQPADLWKESGRWDVYAKELLRIQDRHDRDFCYGPTHEEVVTDIVRHNVKSYRQLPLNLFQIQNKFRDEIRPRFGLMRGREFLMKDAYSFHADDESLDVTYEAMAAAYRRIFEACQLDYIMVDADVGAIGGDASHEFMVVAQTGESEVVRSPDSSYAANVEKAVTGPLQGPEAQDPQPLETLATPNTHAVEDVARFLEVSTDRVLKTLIYDVDNELYAVAIRGDREVNEFKLTTLLKAQFVSLASDEQVKEATGAPVGFAGPIGLPENVKLLVDESARPLTNFVCGANQADAHHIHVNWGRDVEPHQWVDLNTAQGGDPSPPDGALGALEQFRGIEVGHIFKLGTKYSDAMGCTFLDSEGKSHPASMGCYGLGIGRTIAAAIEQNHDDDGIIWPLPLAPFQVLLIALNTNDEAVTAEADRLYQELLDAGHEVFYDDRNERPGVKFKDADLIGIPVRVVVGKKGIKEGKVELSLRKDREKHLVELGEILERVGELLA
ncbi:MAG: proline--tRNA ligase [Acidobacteriota bacterium]